mmetsp:Transcript_212/g.461  ORF Transcript_212/g.461 Transcript_212/m.461 type:complete len:177 (+) Transcript_212:489-1019(+)
MIVAIQQAHLCHYVVPTVRCHCVIDRGSELHIAAFTDRGKVQRGKAVGTGFGNPLCFTLLLHPLLGKLEIAKLTFKNDGLFPVIAMSAASLVQHAYQRTSNVSIEAATVEIDEIKVNLKVNKANVASLSQLLGFSGAKNTLDEENEEETRTKNRHTSSRRLRLVFYEMSVSFFKRG